MKLLAAFIGYVAAWGADGCVDNDKVDSGLDGCDWYTGYEGLCGRYDTDDFVATRDCCDSCTNQYEAPADCVDLEGMDRANRTCEFYKTHWTSCGKFDIKADDFEGAVAFDANDACCACDPTGDDGWFSNWF